MEIRYTFHDDRLGRTATLTFNPAQMCGTGFRIGLLDREAGPTPYDCLCSSANELDDIAYDLVGLRNPASPIIRLCTMRPNSLGWCKMLDTYRLTRCEYTVFMIVQSILGTPITKLLDLPSSYFMKGY
jgi:hypothetical protein